MEIVNFYSLPLQVITALSAGYLGYNVFSTGTHHFHRTHDVVFQSFVFSLPAYLLASHLTVNTSFGGLLVVFLSVASSVILALVLRFAIPIVKKVPSALGVSNENYWPSTWSAMIHDNEFALTRVDILLENGVWLESDLALIPKDAPHYPLDWDHEGNVAVYVTGKVDGQSEREDFGLPGIFSETWGYSITYVPAAKIARYQVCKVREKTR